MEMHHILVKVSVSFTEKEYLALRRQSALLGSGMVSEAVRRNMLLTGMPYGHTKAETTATESDYMQHYFDGKD